MIVGKRYEDAQAEAIKRISEVGKRPKSRKKIVWVDNFGETVEENGRV